MRSILAAILVTFAAACSASEAESAQETNAAVTDADPNAELSARLKAAYEKAGAPGDASILTDVKDIADWSKITGTARENFNMYSSTSSWGGIALVGSPIAQSGTFEGHAITFVAGDLSDTGSEWGFYDENGDALAIAYGGQGEHPGAGGVDWEK